MSSARGLSLRFPRFTGIVREDKKVDQASTGEFLAEMWAKQTKGSGGKGADEGDLVDMDFVESEVEEEEEEED